MAKWIWKRGENRANTWMCFVKDFSCEAVLDTALVKIGEKLQELGKLFH